MSNELNSNIMGQINLRQLCVRITTSFLVWILFVNSTNAQFNQVPDDVEFLALKALYESMGGANWINNSNWDISLNPSTVTSTDFSNWYQVFVSNGDITHLTLISNGLNGNIPLEIGDLSQLKFLALGNNTITGTIPIEIGSLLNLITLNLSKNQMVGNIPNELSNLSQLLSLDLEKNNLNGTIPPSLGNLSNLESLKLGFNNFNGTIPSTLGSLSQLKLLSFANNDLVGSIPGQFGNLIELETLQLGQNDLSSGIPTVIGDLLNLRSIDLSSNRNLGGELPMELGNLLQLEELVVAATGLIGDVPSTLGNLQNLRILTLNANSLISIPPEIGNVNTLKTLGLSDNNLEGLPTSLTNLSLDHYSLGNNYLDFYDLEPFFNGVGGSHNYLTFNYSGQKTILGEVQEFNCDDTSPASISQDIAGEFNIYQWQFNDGSGTFNDIAGENEIDLDYSTISSGEYRLRVENNWVTGLTLYSEIIAVEVSDNVSDQQEYLALKALYESTDGDNWINNTNWDLTLDPATVTSTDFADFTGVLVECGDVTRLRFTNSGLNGNLPSEIGDLSALHTIQIGSNDLLIGTIPPEIGDLNNLAILNLGLNSLTGIIPPELGNLSQLTILDLPVNELSGPIPPELGNLTQLTNLRLTNNDLTGTIPIEIASLSLLEVLGLSSNELNGPVPPQLGDLTQLQYLNLSLNNLDGSIPTSLGDLSQLQTLDLSNNSLVGSIPIEITTLTQLKALVLNSNPLTGGIPPELGDLTNLVTLKLQASTIGGSIPSSLGNLTLLRIIDLNGGGFTGVVPMELGNIGSADPTNSVLQYNFNNNTFTGFEADFANHPAVDKMRLEVQQNKLGFESLEGLFTGSGEHGFLTLIYNPQNFQFGSVQSVTCDGSNTITISQPMGGQFNLYQWQKDNGSGGFVDIAGANLATLDIDFSSTSALGDYRLKVNNQRVSGMSLFSETIAVTAPGSVPDQQEFLALKAFYESTDGDNWNFNTNWDITLNPATVTSADFADWYGITVICGDVNSIFMESNSLNGSLPQELGNLTAMVSLDLGRYDSNNQLTGTLPTQITNLVNLWRLDLHRHHLTGPMPANINQMINLTKIDLHGGNVTTGLDGPIPPAFSSLVSLNYIDLSGNKLSGSVPSLSGMSGLLTLYLYSNDLTQIDPNLWNLTQLRSFNIRENQIAGTLPADLSSFSSLLDFEVGANLLTGPMPIGLELMPNLNTFRVLDNDFDVGPIPAIASGMVTMNLRNTNRTGTIPPSVANLMDAGRIDLSNNDLTGGVPSGFGAIGNAYTGSKVWLWLSDNQLDEFSADFSSHNDTQKVVPLLQNNNLDFGDLEPYFSGPGIHIFSTTTSQSFKYSPQNTTLGIDQTVTCDGSNTLTLSQTIEGLYNLYQWQKDDGTGDFEDVGGIVTESTLDIDFTSGSVAGDYRLKVTNSRVTELTLYTEIITVETPGAVDDQQEYLALKALYESTDGDNWINNTNWDITLDPATVTSADFSNWYGVTVECGDVASIFFNVVNNLDGSIPNEIGDLSALETLLIHSGFSPAITGSIPFSINNLTKLKTLSLSNHRLTSDIPDMSNLTAIEDLTLNHVSDANAITGLSGDIPLYISTLTNLKRLGFSFNNLDGSIPDLSNLVNLTYLLLSNNSLSGDVSSSLWGLTLLEFFNLGNNQLTGNLPSDLSLYPNLIRFGANDNLLTGPMPSGLEQLNQLVDFVVSNNNFDPGILPDFPPQINLIRLSNTNRNGVLPASLGDLSEVSSLWLADNQFSGTVPPEIENIGINRSQVHLNFDNNQLQDFDADFTTGIDPSKVVLWVRDNDLDFGDLEKYFTGSGSHIFRTGVGGFYFSPQNTIPVLEFTKTTDSYTLSTTTPGLQNEYQWYEAFGLLGTPIVNEDLKKIIFPLLELDFDGEYFVEVTNNLVTGLTLTSETVILPPFLSNRCAVTGSNLILNALGSGDIHWYSDEALTDLLFTGPAFVTGLLDEQESYDKIYYLTRDWNGKTSPAISVTIEVRPTPTVELIAPTEICFGEGYNVTATITGEVDVVWKENGVVIPNGNGRNPIPGTYTYEVTASNSCYTTIETIDVEVNPLPVISVGATLELCYLENPYDLTVELVPAYNATDWALLSFGGPGLGDGLIGTSFDPQAPGVTPGEAYYIAYVYTDPLTSCRQTAQRTINVVEPIVIVPTNPIVHCENDLTNIDLFTLVSPANGIFYDGNEEITGGDFVVPDVSVSTDFLIDYEVNFETEYDLGCIIRKSLTITINPITDIVTIGDDMEFCENKSAFDLKPDVQLLGGDDPLLGVFSVTGLNAGDDGINTNNFFDPLVVGPGVYDIIYTYTNQFGCVSSASRQITIYETPSVVVGSTLEVCQDADLYDLVADITAPAGVEILSITGTAVSGSVDPTPNFVFDPDPSQVGQPDILVTYTFLSADGCQFSRRRVITVVNPEVVVLATRTPPTDPPIVETCEMTDPIVLATLPGITPTGGVFRDGGTAITEAVFAVGDYPLTYEYYFSSGCLRSKDFVFRVNPISPLDAGDPIAFCLNDPSYDLMDDVSIEGGYFQGPGVSNQSTFTAENAGVSSNHVVTYYFTNQFGCQTSDTRNIEVFPLPIVDSGPDVTLCDEETVLFDLLAEVSPAGGELLDVDDIVLATTTFNPNGQPLGDYIFKYRFTDANGCTNVDERIVTVNHPTLLAVSPLDICDEGNPINFSFLSGILEGGGVFTGQGVTLSGEDYIFTPQASMIDQDIAITYTVDFGRGCVLSEDFNIHVFDELPSPNIEVGSPAGTVCLNGGVIDLMSTVEEGRKGGEFIGTGVTGRFFDPVVAGVGGPYEITYTYTDPRNCSATNQRYIAVSDIPEITIAEPVVSVCRESPAFSLLDGVTPGGGSFNGGNTFDPAGKNPGLYQLIYTYSAGTPLCTVQAVKSVVILPGPAVDAGPDRFQCPSASNITFTAVGDPNNTYNWTSNQGHNIPNMQSFTLEEDLVADPLTGVTFRVTVIENATSCTSYDEMTVFTNGTEVNPPMAPDVGPICVGEPATLTATGAYFGQRYLWYDALNEGNLLNPGSLQLDASFITGPVGATRNFYVTTLCEDGGESAPRTPVLVTVKDPVPVPTTPEIVYKNLCEASVAWAGFANDSNIPAPGSPLTWYWQTDPDEKNMTEERNARNFVDNTTPINRLRSEYYLRAYDEVKECWSEPSTPIVFSNPVALDPPDVFNIDEDNRDEPQELHPCKDKVVVLPPNNSKITYYFIEEGGSDVILTTNRELVVSKTQDVWIRGKFKEGGAEINCWTLNFIGTNVIVDRPAIPVFQCFNFCEGQQMFVYSENMPNGGEMEWFDHLDNPLGRSNHLNVVDVPSISGPGEYIFTARAYGPEPDRCASDGLGQVAIRIRNNAECDATLNWIQFTAFSDDSPNERNEIASNRQYFDYSGSPTQNQSIDYASADNMEPTDVVISASIKDHLDRNVVRTLPAPGLQNRFAYKGDFALDASNDVYDYSHFDKGTSDAMGSQLPGTLGWYYGPQNDHEVNVPESGLPFTRAIFHEDGSGEILAKTLPGESHQVSSGKFGTAYTFPVTTELAEYFNIQSQAFLAGNGSVYGSETFQQVSRDENGIFNVVIVDEQENPLAVMGEGDGTIDDIVVNASVTLDAMLYSLALDMRFVNASSLKVENTPYIEVYHVSDNNSPVYSGPPEDFVVTGSYQILSVRSTQPFELRAETILSGITICGPCQAVPRNGVTNYHNFYLLKNTNLTFAPGSVGDFKIRNLITDAPVSGLNLDAGFYQITATEGRITLEYDNSFGSRSYNYYDHQGRLVTSISPNGVKQLKLGDAFGIIDKTTYQYDHRNFLTSVTEPDAGTTNYLYRKDGSIRFSQNAQQALDGTFSYTEYDDPGRSIESGEWKTTGAPGFNDVSSTSYLEGTVDWKPAIPGSARDWVKTKYDQVMPLPSQLSSWGYTQEFVEGAVSLTENEEVKTWYSYGEFGRVSWMAQEFKNFMDGANPRLFTMDYAYDFEGNIITAVFQKDTWYEAFWHHYVYDEDNRLIRVSTSLEGTDQYEHMAYEYYKHGPLKRSLLAKDPDDPEETGDAAIGDALQGIDYIYTLQGWLKSINHPREDPGNDGQPGSNSYGDAFHTSLEYFQNDYKNRGNTIGSINKGFFADQFNGNIRSTVWGRDQQPLPIDAPGSLNVDDGSLGDLLAQGDITLGDGFDTGGQDFSAVVNPGALLGLDNGTNALYNYAYDKDYQLEGASFREGDFNSGSEKFKVSVAGYDDNGNIQGLTRKDEGGAIKDNFSYTYTNDDQRDNQLDAVSTYVNEYRYNEIGQLTHEIGKVGTGAHLFIEYDVTGKVSALYDFIDVDPEQVGEEGEMMGLKRFEYRYDDRGFRIAKIAYFYNESDEPLPSKETWYVRDASGNVMAIYAEEGAGDEMIQSELPIYGNSKIGISFRNPSRYKYNYELTDHLGNVRTVISKLKFMETATMEIENGAVEEAAFQNVAETRHPDGMHARESTYSAWLNPADMGSGSAIGPAKSLRVKAGDKVKMEVYGHYIEPSDNLSLVASLGSLLTGSLGLVSSGESAQAFNAIDNLLSGGSLVPANTDNVPKGYLQYLLFNDNYDFVGVLDNSYHKIGTDALNGYEKLMLDVEIIEDGYIYIFVANEANDDVSVWFDDLTVTHTGIDITQNSDYYPFGSLLSHFQKEDYRHGYQGEFAEEDPETGWNQFELRMYDPAIGRWLQIDPERQYSSPYNGLGNNPINGVDPDGAFEVPIHVNITYAIAGAIGIPINSVALLDLEIGVKFTDYIGFALDFHFDNMNGLDDIAAVWNELNSAASSTSSFLELGNIFHTMQDFYAHSNYVISYVDWYAGTHNFELPTSVPIFSDGIRISGFNEYLEKNGLKTGEFSIPEFIVNEKLLGESMGVGSHQQMNLDDGKGYLGKLAVDAAIRQGIESGQDIKKKH